MCGSVEVSQLAEGKSVVIARSNPVAPDPRVEKAARVLGAAGYSVHIVAWDRMGDRAPMEEIDNFTLHRLQIVSEFGLGIRNLPALIRWELGLLNWLRKNRTLYHVVHACDFDTILPALVAKALWRKRVVYDVFDFYVEMLRATPRVIKILIRALDLWAMGKADAVILADDSRKAQISGARPRKIEVIVNTPEDGRIDTAGFSETKPQWSQLHLVFVGLLQLERGMLEILEILSKRPDWSMDLAGFGGDQAVILSRASSMQNVKFHGRVPYKRALALSSLADVIVATYDPSIPNHRYSSPNKLFEAMMLGKPVVVAEHTNMDRIVRAYNCGLVIPYGDVEALEETLARLARDEELRSNLGTAGRRAYDEVFSWNRMADRLISIYADLTG